MRISVIGASGHCGRQFVVQLLDRRLIPGEGLLQLVGHRGGNSESTLWALKADLNDAFCDDAPEIEVILDAEMIQADVVVMLAGRTISTDPSQSADRSELGIYNKALFEQYATSRVSVLPELVGTTGSTRNRSRSISTPSSTD